MSKKLLRKVSFSVSPSFIIERYRDMVLSGEWTKAINSLRESISDFSFDHAIQILSGEKTLVEDLTTGQMKIVDDENSQEYRQEMYEVYLLDLFYSSGSLYKYERMIYEDEIISMMEKNNYNFHPVNGNDVKLDAVRKHFTDNKNEKVFQIETNVYLIATLTDPNLYPIWYVRSDYASSPIEFVRNYFETDENEMTESADLVESEPEDQPQITPSSKKVKSLVYTENELYMNEIAKQSGYVDAKDMSDQLRAKILKACDERGVTWESVPVINDDGDLINVDVPKEIMQGYLLRQKRVSDSSPWVPICESGLKMANDSSWHTDLWLALGNDLSADAYDYDDPKTSLFYNVVNHYRIMLNNNLSDFEILNDVKMLKFKGRVVFENSSHIKDSDILVLPHAGLQYEKIAKKAGVVICEKGGQLSHLVIVGKEEMLPIILMKDAIKILKDQISVEIDFEQKKIFGSF